MGTRSRERRIREAFRATIILKALHAAVELAGGVALYMLGSEQIARWLATDMTAFPAAFAGEGHFYAFYLTSHGIVNMAIVTGLWLEKPWSYPATFAVLSLFIAIQLHRYTLTHDPGLIALTVLDLIVIALARHEYRRVRRQPQHGRGDLRL